MNNITSLELNKIKRTYFENETEMRGFVKGLNQILRGAAQKVEILSVETGTCWGSRNLIRLTYQIPSDY